MRRSRAIRFAVMALAAALAAGCHPLDNVMVDIFGRSMRDQRSFDPYENPRPQPPHTVSFASGTFPPAKGDINDGEPEGVDVPYFTQKDMLPVGKGDSIVQSLVNPGADSVDLARGRTLFVRFCAPCHGADGIGKDAYIASKSPAVRAYDLAGPRDQSFSDQYVYGMIRVGRNLMPEYGSRIAHFDRWDIVNYLRTLQARYNEEHAKQQQGGS
jgi:mono/diheme cytochrome c family protein